MAPTPTEDDESSTTPLPDSCIRDAAADYPVTKDQVQEAVLELQHTLAGQLNELYDDAWMKGGAQIHLLDAPDGVYFALTPHEVRDHLDSKWDTDVVNAVCAAHELMATTSRFTVDRPTSYANKLTADYQPVYIRYPDGWLDGMYHARMRMMYLLHHELTPAEALDYWALKAGHSRLATNKNQSRWHAARGVDHDATYKTIRQAKEKLSDPERQPYYEQQDIGILELGDDH